jgi:hypothetical protein
MMGDYRKELEGIKKYLESDSNEDAKRPLIYPLFKRLFGEKFKTESDAEGADTYIKGELLVELKSKYDQWLDGFFQALHYSKKGLSFPTICVITKGFLAMWKINDIPDTAKKLSAQADPFKAPSEIGVINANKTSKAQRIDILRKAYFHIHIKEHDDLFAGASDIRIDLYEFFKVLSNLDSNRIQINTYDFINHIESLKKFFINPIDAIHCFYAIVGFWDITAIVVDDDPDDYNVQVVSQKTGRISEQIPIKPKDKQEFKKFVESHYIFTNEGSGLTVDYYFSRFDEVITRLNPEYAKQHGIFFTDINLSKFALWFVHEHFEKKLNDKYIVFDPAGGSGNLVTSWHGHLKHKIVSELQPDLLKTIERRFRLTVLDDEELYSTGFTIIPKTKDNKGLNFIDRSASDYLSEIEKVLNEKNLSLDKPIAFLLNPPYKNTDENLQQRENAEAEYAIHEDIIALTGNDAGKERYLAFLAQILNIAKIQNSKNNELCPLLMIFTPTSWLIPRLSYISFRKEFDKHFKFQNGFLITSNEFFKLHGKWPLAFTIWQFNFEESGNDNRIKLWDYTHLKNSDLSKINWNSTFVDIEQNIKPRLSESVQIKFDTSKQDIRETLPYLQNIKTGKIVKQPRYDYSMAKKKGDYGKIVSGFPLSDKTRHFDLQRKCGEPMGQFVGFYDDCTPVRVKQDSYGRMSNKPDRIWFRLDNDFKGVNKTKIHNGCADNRSYCAYNLESAKSTCSWFAITKAINGIYPIWANQFDIWAPKIKDELLTQFYSNCFAFALAENRCIVTRFEKDNPVLGAPEIFVDNPLSPNNPESFWSTIFENELVQGLSVSFELVKMIKRLYRLFSVQYCSSGIIKNVGLENEPYFKYFNYPDFLTPNSGIIQIKKYAELNNKEDLNELFAEISLKTKEVKDEIFRMLVDDFNYFD